MEINAEISRVFGEEMAKLFAAQISEEEMLEKAKEVWSDMQSSTGPSWNRTTPKATQVIAKALGENLEEQVKALTLTTEFQKSCRTLAEKMIKKIQEETHNKVVEEISTRLATMSIGFHGTGLRTLVEEIVAENLGRR